MNLKNVLRTYALLRQLSDDETALLETLWGLSDSDREQLVESLQPGKPAGKKTAKKPASKSRRASSLAEQVKGKRQGLPAPGDSPRCTYLMGDDAPCNDTEFSPLHREDGGYLKWHPFAPPSPARNAAVGSKRAADDCANCGKPEHDEAHHNGMSGNYHPFALVARLARTPSLASGEEQSSTANIETSSDTAHVAAGGSNE